MTGPVRIERVTPDNTDLARSTFALMADVFDEASRPLGDDYLHMLLARQDFIALAALRNGTPIGGLTAHVLPMTRSESSELFLYDIAVHPNHQRDGVGRALVAALREQGLALGIGVMFVPADAEDQHALNFYRAIGGTETPGSIFTFE